MEALNFIYTWVSLAHRHCEMLCLPATLAIIEMNVVKRSGPRTDPVGRHSHTAKVKTELA